MQTMLPVLTIALKEVRELLSRPWQVITLIFGPILIMIAFGIGSDTTAEPPRAIVVGPQSQERPRLLQEYQRQFEQFLQVVDYTSNEEYARAQLRRNRIDAVVILPPAPFETIAQGEQARIQVLYNQIDPLWRWVVPNFTQVLASEINRELFLQTVLQQQASLDGALDNIDLVLQALDLAVIAAETGDRYEAQQHLQESRIHMDQLESEIDSLGPEAQSLQITVNRLQVRLQSADEQLGNLEEADITAETQSLAEQLNLLEYRDQIRQLRATLERLSSVPPNVIISPLTVDATNVARLQPDIVTFYAPSILALLIQHIAVSMGALAFVRERNTGVFDIYNVAPITQLHLLLGKYLAYTLFTLIIALLVLLLLLYGLGVPLLGSPWQMLLILVLLVLASVGLGLLLSLLATSERQAVQFVMLVLLGIVFFSGFTLPLEAIRFPTRAISFLLPATYGVRLLQDVMLRGVLDSFSFLVVLSAFAVGLFGVCIALLYWRTRPR